MEEQILNIVGMARIKLSNNGFKLYGYNGHCVGCHSTSEMKEVLEFMEVLLIQQANKPFICEHRYADGLSHILMKFDGKSVKFQFLKNDKVSYFVCKLSDVVPALITLKAHITTILEIRSNHGSCRKVPN